MRAALQLLAVTVSFCAGALAAVLAGTVWIVKTAGLARESK